MGRKKITSKEIAQLANVSPTAVSFALNNKKGISEETRRHILSIAEELNYRHAAAETPRANMNLAFLFRHDLHALDQLFYTELNDTLLSAINKLPYNFLMVSVYRENNKVVFSDTLRSGDIDGIIVYGDLEADTMIALQALETPFVILDSNKRDQTHPAVMVDYSTAAYTAARYLIDLGHRDIAYIGNNNRTMQDFNVLTFSGFQAATTDSRITLGPNRIQFDVVDEESLQVCIDRAFFGDTAPTALFCATDFYAILAMRYLHSRGLRVPEDISVIGIDDVAISKYMIPSLTTVRIDREKLGRCGLELIQKLVNHEPYENVRLTEHDLIVRESTAPPRRP